MAKNKNRDERAIQTYFRTLSRNQYNVLAMIDRKASIVLTINSIMITLLLLTISQLDIDAPNTRMGMYFTFTSYIGSMVLALLSIRSTSNRNLGDNAKSIMYYGDYLEQSIDVFVEESEKVIANPKELYQTMLKDIYGLGSVIKKKERLINWSIWIFILGVVLNTITASGVTFG